MRRRENINLRVTGAEKALIEERAAAAGLGVSEWLRQVGTLGAKPAVATAKKEPAGSGDALSARVEANVRRGMPRRNAETLAKRELRREAVA